VSAREELDAHLTDAVVSDYVDGTVDAATRADAERHLASCASCRSAVEKTRVVVTLAQRERASVTAPPELWPMVAASTIHLAAMRRQVLASLRGVLIAGAIALVAATAVVTWKLARWSAARDVPAAIVGVNSSGPGPGRHAGHAGHPTAPEPPRAPAAPRP
jgi:predicted anti-sigma-YlaC factor YlaD